MRKKFSDLAVERIKGDPAKRVEHSDALLPALRLCVFPSGARSWILRTRIGGRTVKLTIGNAAVLPVAEARAKARDALSRVERGEDPRLAAAEEAAARRLTLGGVVRDYLEHRAADRLKPRTVGEARRALEVLWSPLHHLPVARVPRARVAARLLEIKAERGPIAANRARAYLSGCFTWAVRQGLAEANPVAGTEAPGVERRRERVLGLEELRLLWRATEEPFGYHRVVRLLILLGARRDEVGAMAWGELSDGLATWVLPASRTKTGQPRELPLPRQAIGIIAGAAPIAGQAQLFGRNGFQAWSQSKARLDRRLAALAAGDGDCGSLARPALPAWTLHDLRRSFITHVHELALAPPWIVDEIVGHVGEHRRGARAHYNRATYREQKARALQAWADHLLDATAAAVVVPFRASA